jgi:hypothetical protein
LLKNNNKTTNWAALNYAIGGGKLLQGPRGNYYEKDCRAEQTLKSLPHLVYIAFGFMDGMDLTYNEEEYKKIYSTYIKKIQDLPSKPIVML